MFGERSALTSSQQMQVTKKRRGSDIGGFTQKSRKTNVGGPSTQQFRKAVNKQIRANLEAKYFDKDTIYTLASGNNWNSTTAEANAFIPIVGDNIDQRDGRKVTIHKIKIRGLIRCPPQDGVGTLNADDATTVRIIYSFDEESVGASSAGNLLIRDPQASNQYLANIQMQNIDNAGKFRVIWDQSFKLENPNNFATGVAAGNIYQYGLEIPFEKTIKFAKPVEVVFYKDTNAGTYADILKNNLQVHAHATSIQLAPALYLSTRTYYKEQNKTR